MHTTERWSIVSIYCLPTVPLQNALAFGSLLPRCRLATKTHGAHSQKPGFRRRHYTLHLQSYNKKPPVLLEVVYAYYLMLTFMLTHNYSTRLTLHVKNLINSPLDLLPPTTSSGDRASQTSSHSIYLFYEAIFAGVATTCAGHGDKGLGSGGMRVEA